MLGAIAGDIIGSRFEWHNHKSTEFTLFAPGCRPTDDSTMTIAVAKAILASDGKAAALDGEAVVSMQTLGKMYPYGYGKSFWKWLNTDQPKPYGSYGNGAAMRVSPCAWAGGTLKEAFILSDTVTNISHNHPESVDGARAVTACVYLALHGADKDEIREHVRRFYYPLDTTLDEIRPVYHFDVSCQGSVPWAIEAFLESADFEDGVRLAVSIGGDSDTIAAITGSIAEAFYGIPLWIRDEAMARLDSARIAIVNEFETRYGRKDA